MTVDTRTYEERRAYFNQRKAEIKARVKAWINAYKEDRGCMDCGGTFPAYVLDLDHVRGEKLFTVSQFGRHSISIDVVRREVEKCDVVCANCHRIRTQKTIDKRKAVA